MIIQSLDFYHMISLLECGKEVFSSLSAPNIHLPVVVIIRIFERNRNGFLVVYHDADSHISFLVGIVRNRSYGETGVAFHVCIHHVFQDGTLVHGDGLRTVSRERQ